MDASLAAVDRFAAATPGVAFVVAPVRQHSNAAALAILVLCGVIAAAALGYISLGSPQADAAEMARRVGRLATRARLAARRAVGMAPGAKRAPASVRLARAEVAGEGAPAKGGDYLKEEIDLLGKTGCAAQRDFFFDLLHTDGQQARDAAAAAAPAAPAAPAVVAAPAV